MSEIKIQNSTIGKVSFSRAAFLVQAINEGSAGSIKIAIGGIGVDEQDAGINIHTQLQNAHDLIEKAIEQIREDIDNN